MVALTLTLRRPGPGNMRVQAAYSSFLACSNASATVLDSDSVGATDFPAASTSSVGNTARSMWRRPSLKTHPSYPRATNWGRSR
jgi:hypothetical protein